MVLRVAMPAIPFPLCMKTIILYLTAVLTVGLPVSAQNYHNEVYRSDSNNGSLLRSIVVTDSAWYISGVTTVVADAMSQNFGWFIRYNPNEGSVVSQRIYGDINKPMKIWTDALIATKEGNLACTGIDFGRSFFALLNTGGDTLAYKLYAIPNDTSAYATQIKQADDGNYYIVAAVSITGTSLDPESTRVCIIKISPSGDILKQHNFAFPDPICNAFMGSSDIEILPNGHFIVSAVGGGFCGAYHPPLETCRTRTWIFEADSLGNIVNQYLSPETDRYIDARKLTLTHDGGILFSGTEEFIGESVGTIYFSPHQYIGKLDSNYELVWEYTSKEPHLGYLSRSVEMADGSIWVCGKDKDRRGDTIEYRGILLKFSSDGDSIGRQKFYRLSYPYHSSLTDLWYDQASHFFQDMVMLPDSSLVLVGEVVVNYIPSPIAGYWGWVVHTDKYGCVESEGCFPVGLAQSPIPPWEAVRVAWCKVYPNPAQDYLVVENNSLEKSATFVLYDVMGTRVLSLISHNQSVVSVEHLPSGVYLYQFVNPKNQILQQGKVSIVR